jgi:hypothetical protein
MAYCAFCRVKLEDTGDAWEVHRATSEHKRKVQEVVEDDKKYKAMKMAIPARFVPREVQLFNDDEESK